MYKVFVRFVPEYLIRAVLLCWLLNGRLSKLFGSQRIKIYRIGLRFSEKIQQTAKLSQAIHTQYVIKNIHQLEIWIFMFRSWCQRIPIIIRIWNKCTKSICDWKKHIETSVGRQLSADPKCVAISQAIDVFLVFYVRG